MFQISRLSLPFRPLGLLTALVIALALAAGITAASAAASDKKTRKDYALIFGTVWGPDKRAVYGVRIRIRRADSKKAKWEVYSDRRGEFAQRVPVGPADYVLWAEAGNYKSSDGSKLQPGKEVTVRIESDERVDIGLHLIK
jgi:hypothetical protein